MAKSRAENILTAMINQTPYAEYPQSRLEDLLLQLKEVYEQGGGGSTPTAADVSYDNTTSGMTADDVQDAIDEVFQSVSSGKTLIAGAITDKGVTTSATDSFATMAANIASIPTGGNAEFYSITTADNGGTGASLRVIRVKDGDVKVNRNLKYTDGTLEVDNLRLYYSGGWHLEPLNDGLLNYDTSGHQYTETWAYNVLINKTLKDA